MPRPSALGGASRLLIGLVLTPSIVGLAALAFPALRVGPGLANVIAFAGATLVPIVAIAILARAVVALTVTLSIAAVTSALALALAFLHPSALVGMVLVDGALVGFAWAIGASVGRRVQHASHLLPACVVAASADIVSLLSPEGPTHAIAKSDRALSILALWFPVPGTHAVAPALGVGDLLFMALVFGVAAVHGLPYARTVVLAFVGTSLAGLAAAWLGVAVPALVPIAAVLVLGLPAVRRVRPADRVAAKWSIVIACSVVVAVAARALLER